MHAHPNKHTQTRTNTYTHMPTHTNTQKHTQTHSNTRTRTLVAKLKCKMDTSSFSVLGQGYSTLSHSLTCTVRYYGWYCCCSFSYLFFIFWEIRSSRLKINITLRLQLVTAAGDLCLSQYKTTNSNIQCFT